MAIRGASAVYWIWCVLIMLNLWAFVDAQPLSCEEDAHCSEGYYCVTQHHVCYPCLQCQDLNRFVPEVQNADTCIQSIESCGPCLEGFVNIYKIHGTKGKCVSPELLQFESKSFCVYVWMIAAITGSFLVVVCVYVIKNTLVLQIVPNHHIVAAVSQQNNKALEPVVEQSMKKLIFKEMNDEL